VLAVNDDFGGPHGKDSRSGIGAPRRCIRHARRHLASWMKPRKVRAGFNFFPATAASFHQPLASSESSQPGIIRYFCVISTGSMPFSAGNHVMIKPSELCPRPQICFQQINAAAFPEEYVAVVTAMRRSPRHLPLFVDHLLFTGSTRVANRSCVQRAKLRPSTAGSWAASLPPSFIRNFVTPQGLKEF